MTVGHWNLREKWRGPTARLDDIQVPVRLEIECVCILEIRSPPYFTIQLVRTHSCRRFLL